MYLPKSKINLLQINVLIILLFAGESALSQDKIISTKDDTLFCKIIKLESDFIYYKEQENLEERAIPTFRVKEIYYGDQRIAFDGNSRVRKYVIFKQPEWRLDIGAGWAYFLEIPTDQFGPGYEEFFNSVRNGRNIYAEIAKYPDLRFGGGLEFQYSNFYSSDDGVTIFDSTLVLKGIGRAAEDIHIFYLQPKGYYSIFSSTWDFTAGGGIILAYLRRTIQLLNETYAYRGGNLGLGVSAAIDHKLSSNFAIGLRTSFSLVFISEITLNGKSVQLDENEFFSASQFNLCMGVKYLW